MPKDLQKVVQKLCVDLELDQNDAIVAGLRLWLDANKVAAYPALYAQLAIVLDAAADIGPDAVELVRRTLEDWPQTLRGSTSRRKRA